MMSNVPMLFGYPALKGGGGVARLSSKIRFKREPIAGRRTRPIS